MQAGKPPDDSQEMQQRRWIAQFEAFGARRPDKAGVVQRFVSFVREHADAARRELRVGHLTGSAWLVSADGQRVLLTHHKKLGLWLQLGGHADGDADLAGVALREANEESGLIDLVVEGDVYDLDCHEIPARGAESAHYHYDVRFVVRATGSEQFAVSDESHALAWRGISEVADDATIDASVRRMAQTWLKSFAPLPLAGEAGTRSATGEGGA